MRPQDKDGHTIYSHVYRRMVELGRRLEGYGYVESKKTPNLFYRKYSRVMFFADLNGTSIVPIGEITQPHWWWMWLVDRESVPLEYRQRMVAIEMVRLVGIPLRLSHELHHDWDMVQELGGLHRDVTGRWTEEEIDDLFLRNHFGHDGL